MPDFDEYIIVSGGRNYNDSYKTLEDKTNTWMSKDGKTWTEINIPDMSSNTGGSASSVKRNIIFSVP